MSSGRRRTLALLLTAALGLVAGGVGGTALARVWAEAQPDGWRKRVEPTPYMTPTTYGPLPVTGDVFVLGHYETLLAPTSATAVEVGVILPEDGELVIYPRLSRTNPVEGVGVILRPGSSPRSIRTTADQGAEEQPCNGDRTAIAADVRADARVSLSPDGTLTVASNGRDWSCPGPGRAEGPAALQAGLRRVLLPLISVDGVREPPPLSPLIRVACAIGGSLALVVLVGVETRLGMGWLGAAVGWLPLLLSAVLAARDLSSLHDLLRMPSLPVQALPLGAGVGIALGGKVLLHAIRMSRHGPMGWLGAVGLGGLLGVVPGLLAGAPAMAVGLFAFTGGALAALGAVQGHARTMRGYNLISLLLAVCALLGLEAGIRQTSVGDFWNGQDRSRGAGTATTLASEFEALAAAEPTIYPSEGYPVLAPPKSAPLRIVCLGGSSTGGAFQNGDLADFYPARLAERLGSGIEVINQGTGGWNSLHIALFAEQSLARLQPDIVTVYAGVNDQVEAPIQYRALHSAWASGALKPKVNGLLDNIRLFQGLRYSVRGLRGSVIAVPPEHTADNLRRVARAARDVGARTLLLSEAVQPRPEAFAPYWRAMGAVAEEHPDTAFVHTAEHLRGLGPMGFLDQNHLSDLGHGKLAERLEAALRGQGWLQTRGAPPAGATRAPGR